MLLCSASNAWSRLAFRCWTFDPDVLPEPTKSLKRLTHRNRIPLGQQGPSFIHNARHLLFGDDSLVEAANAVGGKSFLCPPPHIRAPNFQTEVERRKAKKSPDVCRGSRRKEENNIAWRRIKSPDRPTLSHGVRTATKKVETRGYSL
jgi:hypothetical protein